MSIALERIVVGDRRRQDLGDVSALARSLQKWGLLHPIVVDAEDVLVAGGRRVAAARMLGWAEIDASWMDRALTPEELWDLELAENGDRKDLTAYERSLDRVKRAEEAEAALASKLLARSKKPDASRGKGKARVGEQDVADAIGENRQTLRNAKAHVEAVEKYPDLKSLEESRAIRVARALDATPEVDRLAKLAVVRELIESPPLPGAVRDAMARIEDAPGVRSARFRKRASTALRSARTHLLGLDPVEVAAILGPADAVVWRDFADQCRGWFDRLEAGLRRGVHAVGG